MKSLKANVKSMLFKFQQQRPSKQNLDEFENEVGDIIRGYRLESGDVFSVTAEALSGRPAKGSKVGIGAGTKLVVGNTNAIGTIIDVEVAGRYTYYVIKVD